MIVYEFNGTFECKNLSDLLIVLKHRSSSNSNDFELSTECEYPSLTILIKDDYACVHFFSDENDSGHCACSSEKCTTENYVVFNIGSEKDLSEISMDIVISVEQAYEAAKCFFEKHEMSEKIKWTSL